MTSTDTRTAPAAPHTASLAGKVAVITGAGSGIGLATANAFAAAGAYVVLADVDTAHGETAAAEIRSAGGKAMFVTTDVSSDEHVRHLIDAVVREFGTIDIAFNNAGIEGESAPTHECSISNWKHTIGVDLTGVFLCMRYQIPVMLKNGGGSIINNASIAGLVGFPGIPAYTASKHGIVGLTKGAALEYATRNIRVNAVCPGVIDTPMIDRFTHGDPEAAEALTASEPVGRLGTPDEIARAVLWLASDDASFVTGQAIAIDGGYVAR